ncbi:MAG TPA: maltose alpha-D-glucosyltransferase [Rhodanobacteraceae bacterium]|nr:maltose alpha-D-glucosyltransferase [Rhodanobacteraceae bacterium]
MPATDPLWYRDAVIYQLHVKSFFDGNGDGIGDFRGLIQKLDYLCSLGVTAIWLLPFYPSPLRDDGYDISDYCGVHADYGTLADVAECIAACHQRDLRVVTELVVNHTSDQHPWFQRARAAPADSPERDYYVWSDSDARYPGTRIIFCDTETSNWTWDAQAGAYYWHRFYSHQPDLNFDNPRVLDDILRAMRFWLDLGVDGLRLDAVPYLVERDGTSNENLPETHAVLKRLRAELDRDYPGRMLLAEANQWPEDAQEYFGHGDECHMAFHFPLMPRMYMAIAQEDRFPITDILRQTPAIPEGCQWAIFLRNHDELTLEMVTDRERDYLWNVYAADRRARLNLGIRRRLASLLERDRRRIELMTCLLLTLPGTPVLYYGDEIGMGDNIHLGDRDGVRTPMQWTTDRNGGFSRADPEALVLPPLMGPVSGYAAVNVEAQERDAHSLLNWMRRMLALRRARTVFGRGELRVLKPGNRRVLAYLRSNAEQTVLCVANLANTPQAVELDLAEFEGRTPLELTGGTVFPPIGQLSYLLTLSPYGFYWFELVTDGEVPDWHALATTAMPDYVTLVLRRGIGELLDGRLRETLERECLQLWLPMRRWFAGKGTDGADAVIAAAIPLPGAPQLLLSMIDAGGEDRRLRYAVPLGIAWDDDNPGALAQRLALARVRMGRRTGYLADAFALDSLALGLLHGFRNAALEQPETGMDPAGGAGGTLVFRRDAPLDDFPGDADSVRRLDTEQSNSTLVIGERMVVKLLRQLHEGPHPEAEMARHLAAVGFEHMPPLLGELAWQEPARGASTTIALAHRYIDNQGDAWSWIRHALERVLHDLAIEPVDGEDLRESLRPLGAFAGVIGRRLAQLHLALARPGPDPAFAPEHADADLCAQWVATALHSFDDALASVRRSACDAGQLAELATLEAALPALRERLPRHLDACRDVTAIRIHGDLHLGQILVAAGDALFIDFEGEPTRPLIERRAKCSPWRDVAGMLRSFVYVTEFEPERGAAVDEEALTRRSQALSRVCRDMRRCFLRQYRRGLHRGGWASGEIDDDHGLLDVFLLAKASYEVQYEAAYRPDWLRVPLRGLGEIVRRLLQEAPR